MKRRLVVQRATPVLKGAIATVAAAIVIVGAFLLWQAAQPGGPRPPLGRVETPAPSEPAASPQDVPGIQPAIGSVTPMPPAFPTTAPQAAASPPAGPTGIVGKPADTPASTAVTQPLAVAPAALGLGFDGWSPDSQWIAYWVGEAQGPATLTFVNVQTRTKCPHEEVTAQGGRGRLIWEGDDRVIVILGQQGEAFGGSVCQTFAPVESDIPAGRVTSVDISPAGRYQAETRIVRWEGEAMYKSLTITDLSAGRPIATASYLGSPHTPSGGPQWLNNELYLIGKTVDRGVLYVSLPEGRIGHLLPEFFALDAGEEEYVWLVHSQADRATGEYHLLIQQYKDDMPSLPLLLYHSELDQVEEVAFYTAWPFFDGSSFTPDGVWLLLGNPVEEGDPGAAPDYWLRPVDPPGSPAIKIVRGMTFDELSGAAQPMAQVAADAVLYNWASCGLSRQTQQMAFCRDKSVRILSLADGGLLGEWQMPSYEVRYLWWSPDGSLALAAGYDAQREREALFVIEAP